MSGSAANVNSRISTELAVRNVANLIKTETNGRAYLVGGCVRDMQLYKNELFIKDYDIEVFGVEPDELKRVLSSKFEIDLVGESFGIIKLKHYPIDISIPRRERKIGDGHRGFDVYSDPNMTMEEAANRRDFTINALYYDPLENKTYDPTKRGLADLQNRSLNIISSRFKEDPLRVFRGMQMIARFRLTPTGETVLMCRTMTMEGLPQERIYDEFVKLFVKGDTIAEALFFLKSVGWAKYFPGLDETLGICDFNHLQTMFSRFVNGRLTSPTKRVAVGFSLLLCRNPKMAEFLDMVVKESAVLKDIELISKTWPDAFNVCFQSLRGDDGTRNVLHLAQKCKNILLLTNFLESMFDMDCRYVNMEAARLMVIEKPPVPLFTGKDLISLGFKPGENFGVILDRMLNAQLNLSFKTHDEAVEYFKENATSILGKSTIRDS